MDERRDLIRSLKAFQKKKPAAEEGEDGDEEAKEFYAQLVPMEREVDAETGQAMRLRCKLSRFWLVTCTLPVLV